MSVWGAMDNKQRHAHVKWYKVVKQMKTCVIGLGQGKG